MAIDWSKYGGAEESAPHWSELAVPAACAAWLASTALARAHVIPEARFKAQEAWKAQEVGSSQETHQDQAQKTHQNTAQETHQEQAQEAHQA